MRVNCVVACDVKFCVVALASAKLVTQDDVHALMREDCDGLADGEVGDVSGVVPDGLSIGGECRDVLVLDKFHAHRHRPEKWVVEDEPLTRQGDLLPGLVFGERGNRLLGLLGHLFDLLHVHSPGRVSPVLLVPIWVVAPS